MRFVISAEKFTWHVQKKLATAHPSSYNARH